MLANCSFAWFCSSICQSVSNKNKSYLLFRNEIDNILHYISKLNCSFADITNILLHYEILRYISVLFPAVMIKMLNFGTCFITSIPIKSQNDTFKSISLTSLKTQRDFVRGFFKNWIHHICVLPDKYLLFLLFHNSRTLIYWDNQNNWKWRVNLIYQYFVKLHLFSQYWQKIFDIFFKTSFTQVWSDDEWSQIVVVS